MLRTTALVALFAIATGGCAMNKSGRTAMMISGGAFLGAGVLVGVLPSGGGSGEGTRDGAYDFSGGSNLLGAVVAGTFGLGLMIAGAASHDETKPSVTAAR